MREYISSEGRHVLYCDGKLIMRNRYIWEYYNGSIPDGYKIHHIDHNKSNDDINNLCMMSDFEHRSYHGRNKSEETRDKARKSMIGKNKAESNGMYGTRADNPSARRVLCVSTNEEFSCIADAVDKYRNRGAYCQNIIKVCQGKRNTCAGFIWKYIGNSYYIDNKGKV